LSDRQAPARSCDTPVSTRQPSSCSRPADPIDPSTEDELRGVLILAGHPEAELRPACPSGPGDAV